MSSASATVSTPPTSGRICLPRNRRGFRISFGGRVWTWIEGNHDRGAAGPGGETRVELALGPLTFRHIARPDSGGEVSGHYHPKARLALRGRMISRPCFLIDADRLILPAYGAYTGGLRTDSPTLSDLMAPGAHAILCGPKPARIPMPRAAAQARTGT